LHLPLNPALTTEGSEFSVGVGHKASVLWEPQQEEKQKTSHWQQSLTLSWLVCPRGSF